jgi:hypothetical protein
MKQVVVWLLVAVAALVSWALAEWRFEGWKKRKRRIVLLLVLAVGAQLIAWRILVRG